MVTEFYNRIAQVLKVGRTWDDLHYLEQVQFTQAINKILEVMYGNFKNPTVADPNGNTVL